MTTRLQNYINGKFVDAKSGRFSDVVDPSTGEVYAQAPVGTGGRRRGLRGRRGGVRDLGTDDSG